MCLGLGLGLGPCGCERGAAGARAGEGERRASVEPARGRGDAAPSEASRDAGDSRAARGAGAADGGAPRALNVLYLTVDSLRGDVLTARGGSPAAFGEDPARIAPHLTALARRGWQYLSLIHLRRCRQNAELRLRYAADYQNNSDY